ncbi:SRPBCC family protein [Actinoplanes oblitus]|uniref:SRPBCC family protein n=1 Tax=Actinoplanes oblitus TaxID=3040509 RepID=A0ABY8W436_9ACTN|nr:SRPBCC family protein [Actinoplanes oblitus]WIM92468.1 SRPBCC family protein [Actinoplanes oblitus]
MRYWETIDIDAPVALIWRLTTDIEDWPDFLPTVRRLDRLDTGELRVGSAARLEQPGQSSAVWTVTHLEPDREFTWETHRPGLRLTGRHLLEPVGAGTRMTLVLETAGWAAGLASVLFGGMMRGSLRRESEGFARRATAGV